MNIQLVQGEFSPKEALELITQWVHLKIRYHENKIAAGTNEEDIKFRESKIKRLQEVLVELRKTVAASTGNLKLEGTLKIR